MQTQENKTDIYGKYLFKNDEIRKMATLNCDNYLTITCQVVKQETNLEQSDIEPYLNMLRDAYMSGYLTATDIRMEKSNAKQ